MEILVIDECELNSHSEPFFKLIFASILFFFSSAAGIKP